jgi:cyclopropane-fatty-acyl-phospholipid synthase
VTELAARLAISIAERAWMPDALLRAGIRALCRERLASAGARDPRRAAVAADAFFASIADSPLVLEADRANAQHYEQPAELFRLMLGPQLKYSCALWEDGAADLAAAEDLALARSCEHAQLCDGQEVLELGCGWGSLSLWMARHYPASRITAISNSASQRRWIEARAAERGLANLQVLTTNIDAFNTDRRFDRIVSVEMFEHVRNWPRMFARVHGWLRPGGRFFMHVFCHRLVPYPFEEEGAGNWMGRYFFSGGMMPSADLAARCRGALREKQRWWWPGTHYQLTAEAWLANLDRQRDEAIAVLARAHGERHALLWLQRWRMFLLACSELFGYAEGSEWGVSHHLFARDGGAMDTP